MHPQVFLRTFWRLELRPQVFVAMDFGGDYQGRFEQVIAPAIEAIEVDGQPLKPCRIDLSKSGDSILTEIIDGIAHSQLILADVSTIGMDSKNGKRYRNGNVMYEVGLALACRHPSEVLLVRDDEDPFLFDVSTISHKKIEFSDTKTAVTELREELRSRLKEQKYVNDARVHLATAGLTDREVAFLKKLAGLAPESPWVVPDGETQIQIVPRLLEKQLIRLMGLAWNEGAIGSNPPLGVYQLTPLGHEVASAVKRGLPTVESEVTMVDLYWGIRGPLKRPG